MAAIIITGSAAGNGLAIARRFMRDGHRVVGVDRAPALAPGMPVHVHGDVLDDAVIAAAFENALANNVDELFLINNAGITTSEFPASDETWSHVLNVNLAAPFRWARQFARYVAEGRIKQGGIIFIGSLASTTGFPRNPAYQASKSGIVGLMRSFAYDLGPHGIRVNCVSPGYIHTAMTNLSYNTPALHEARRRHTLLGRWGEPEDVANAVAFLCGPDASYITGVNLPVDGGWQAKGLIEDL